MKLYTKGKSKNKTNVEKLHGGKMNNILKKIDFGNEAADDEDLDVLTEYFVEQSSFRKFLNPAKRILIATARKGVGKSALLQWASHKIGEQDPDALVIKCKGADLVRSRFGLSAELTSPNDRIQDWVVRLCTLVNRQLAIDLKIGLTDDQITLIETAEIEGYRSRNLCGCLLDRFQSLINKGNITKVQVQNELELLKRVKNRKVCILIDDLDATYQNTDAESLDLATFFSACRYLIQDVKDISFRITVRTDVWSVIRRYDESLDKVEQYVEEVLWSEEDFRRLLALRVKASLKSLNIPIPKVPQHVQKREEEEHLLEMVFSSKMKWGGKLKAAYMVLYTMSYERPRWAIQLCKLAQEAAIRNRGSIIEKDNIDEIWGEYGAKRIADLVSEHKHQCPQVEELLNAFRGSNRQLTRDELLGWVNNRITTHMEPIIENVPTRSSMKIAHFLYRIGFIMARSENEAHEYEHYRFDQMPDFLTARTNADFGVNWEIHPCYREALDITKLNRSHRHRFQRLREDY